MSKQKEISDIAYRISERLKALGLSRKGASTLAGLSQDAIQNIFRNPESVPNGATLNKLAGVLKTTTDFLLSGDTSARFETLEMRQTEVFHMPVRGVVAAGHWKEDDELVQEPGEFIPMADDSRYASHPQYALRVEGESMNKSFPNGSYVIVVEEFGRELRNEDVVVVLRKRGGFTERTIKIARQSNGQWELHPNSTEASYTPFIIDGDENTVIEIEGYAIGSYRPI